MQGLTASVIVRPSHNRATCGKREVFQYTERTIADSRTRAYNAQRTVNVGVLVMEQQGIYALTRPLGMTLGVYGDSQSRVRADSRARDARYTSNPSQGFEVVYTATVDGIERSFARVSVKALGWVAGGSYAQILESLPGELCSLEAMEQIVAQVTEPGDVFTFAAGPVPDRSTHVFRGQKGSIWTDGHAYHLPALMPETDLVFMLPCTQ